MWGSRRHTEPPKHLTYSIPRDEGYEGGVERDGVPRDTPPKHLTYSIPRDEGYEGGVVRCGVPGDTPHAPNHQNILPILSSETRAMKEAL